MLLMVVYCTPEFLQFTVPMSVMMAVLLTFLRMAVDNEIIAVKAGGGNIYHLLAPVLLFSLLGFALTITVTVYGLVWGNDSYERLIVDIAARSADASLKEGTFNDSIDGVMFYVNKIDIKNKILYDVFIEDSRNENNRSTIIAPKGKRFTNKENTLFTLRLFNGVINKVNIDDKSVNTISFDTYDLELNLHKETQKQDEKSKSRKAKTIGELKAFIEESKELSGQRTAEMEIHKRFALPFACIALGLLAMPLGLKSAFSRKTSGLGLGLTCFLLYYFLMGTGMSCGKNGLLPPAAGIWLPDIIMMIIGIVFLVRVAKEKPVGFGYGIIAGLTGRVYRRLFRTQDDE